MPASSEARTLAIEFVDEKQLAREAHDAREQDFEDARIRLGDAHVARDDARVEFVEEWVSLPREREFLGGEVAQRMNRTAGGLQTPHERDVLLDRPSERLDPPRVEQPQFLGEFGKGGRPLGHRLREIRERRRYARSNPCRRRWPGNAPSAPRRRTSCGTDCADPSAAKRCRCRRRRSRIVLRVVGACAWAWIILA